MVADRLVGPVSREQLDDELVLHLGVLGGQDAPGAQQSRPGGRQDAHGVEAVETGEDRQVGVVVADVGVVVVRRGLRKRTSQSAPRHLNRRPKLI